MDTPFLSHFLFEERVHQSVAGRLHFGLEGFRCDDEPEVSFARGAVFHGFVVGVEVGVIVDFERGGGESSCDLWEI